MTKRAVIKAPVAIVLLVSIMLFGCETYKSNAEWHNNQALDLVEQHRYDEALQECNKAIELDPNYAIAYGTRAFIYIEKGQYDLTIADCNKAIELKVKAEQEALQALNEKTRRVTQAEAAYLERKLAADGEAYEIEAASKAKADAIAREAKALKDNPQLIQLTLAEKWDGTLPKFTGGETVPLINIDTVLKGK